MTAEFVVLYQAGEYSGTRTVSAEDEEQAIAMVRAKIRREMSLPMYSESYRVVGLPLFRNHLVAR